jgi:DNA-binding CsgD family transcriptional regulator
MNKPISPAEKTVGILLANGFTKKEIANRLNKSERTICRQADDLYKKTGSRNLADITRNFIQRYTGLPVEDILINAMKNSLVFLAIAFIAYVLITNKVEIFDSLKTSLFSILK